MLNHVPIDMCLCNERKYGVLVNKRTLLLIHTKASYLTHIDSVSWLLASWTFLEAWGILALAAG